MGSTVEKVRIRRRAPTRRPPRRYPPARRGLGRNGERPARSIPKAAPDAFERARRRRFMVRRVACVIAISMFLVPPLLGTVFRGAASTERTHARPVSPVELRPLPGPPVTPPPDMTRTWATAVAEDPWPALAVGGSVGTSVGTSGGKVALTFDDGPDPQTTPLILDTLRERNARAAFFVVGRQVAENPNLLRRIVAEGHAVGNHTYDHADMSGLSAGQMREELRSTQEAVDEALGYHYPMALMRPPYGNPYLQGSDALATFRWVVRGEGLFPVMWTVDPGDYLMDDRPGAIVRGVARAEGAGRDGGGDEVVLLHDNQAQTAEALPAIIDHYEELGRRFVGVDELLADKYATDP